MGTELRKHRYYRIADGRLIDMTDREFLEYRNDKWISGTGHMCRFILKMV